MPSSTVERPFYVLVIIFGAVLTYYAYFPGLMANDSSTQFHQAQIFRFDDWHPPILALIWSLTNKIVPGPEGFFLLQITLYWGGFLLIGLAIINELDRSSASFLRYVILCILPFSPFLLNICGTIWKDVLVFGCFGVALGLILLRPRGSAIWTWRSAIIWGLLVIGSLARHNSFVAAVPLLVLHLWPRAPARRQLRALLARGFVAGALTITAVFGVDKALDALVLHSVKKHMENEIFLFDLVGISHRIHHNLVPGRWPNEEANQILTTCYSVMHWDPLSPWGYCHFVFDRLWEQGTWQNGLLPLWALAVIKYPREYLTHRVDYMHTLLWPQTTFTFTPNSESFEFGFTKNGLFRFISDVMVFIDSHFPLYLMLTVAFWLCLSFALSITMFILYMMRPDGYYRAMLVTFSGGFYAAPLAVVGPGGDYRYVYWAAGATCIAALLAPQRHRSPAPRPPG
jgi:hypothetical protein